MTTLFISYRRDDSPYAAGQIRDRLVERFDDKSVFFDIDSVPLGSDFEDYINEKVSQCDVLLVVIGDSWLKPNEDGQIRLDDPSDFVRIEIEAALARDIPIIPVPVGKAGVPSKAELPESISKLASRNAQEVRAGTSFQGDMKRLVNGIETITDVAAEPKPRKLVKKLVVAAFIVVLGITGVFTFQFIQQRLDNAEIERQQTVITEAERRRIGNTVALNQQGCEDGNARSCNDLGVMYQYAIGVELDYAQAMALYRQACEGGDPRGCRNLGAMYGNGDGVAQDSAQAMSLFQQACEDGDAQACTNLGMMYERGDGVTKDDVQAIAFYQQGCEGGDVAGCTNLGMMYDRGDGVAQDDAQAVAFYQQGCEGGDALGCRNLGVMYGTGEGVAKDDAQAMSLFQQACEDGDAVGCTNLGGMYAREDDDVQDYAQALVFYQQGCEGGDARGCTNLGSMYEYGDGVAQDDVQALAFYQQGCEGGDSLGCTLLEIAR